MGTTTKNKFVAGANRTKLNMCQHEMAFEKFLELIKSQAPKMGWVRGKRTIKKFQGAGEQQQPELLLGAQHLQHGNSDSGGGVVTAQLRWDKTENTRAKQRLTDCSQYEQTANKVNM
ncbi:unnamed protein product [Ceratitis capitata]|uniref:(Mediterranean fruit fly) hypothetical protein n=1 Tax=Ceratitis capitata TaxID=7213 RepID=A0A811V318_CERCA|nr:unnamed protein product [Ceratitis capitata]